MSFRDREANKPQPGQGNSVTDANVRRIKFQNELIADDFWHCCLNCEDWSDGNGDTPMGCKLKRAMPPPEVFIVGCPEWSFDIPF